jgi:hypothetical protein
MNKDLDNLKTLSIFYYVVAVLIALFACFPIIHLIIGLSFLTGAIPEPPSRPNEPDFPVKLFGLMFTIIPLIFIIGGWALAICAFIAGRKLVKQQSYVFCLVVAGILCTFMPFGTVLGVFTIIVLMRDSVKELFNGQNFSQYKNAPTSWQ